MSPRQEAALAFTKRLFLFIILSTAATFLIKGIYALSQAAGSQEKAVSVEVKQLPLENGIVPIDVRCDDVKVVGSAIERLSCILKNNSAKAVTAAAIRITITLERAGKESQDSGLLTVDSQWQSPVRDERESLIPPAGQYRLADLPSDYDDAVIRAIEIHLDYIEFADQNSLGPDSGASRKIGEARTGAAKYRQWLGRELEKTGGSVEAILPLLERYKGLPPELESEGGNQQEGAKRYRSYIRQMYLTNGSEGVRRQLKPTRTSASK